MNLPVDQQEFWEERIDRAKKENRYHYSVYLARQTLWDEIERAHKEILSRETPGYKVLDAGCGYGRASEWVENYTGVDISQAFIDEANKRYPGKKFIQNDLRNLPFKDGEFDVAFCISIKQMIIGNLGGAYWEEIEKELLRVADKLIILEYENPTEYYII